MISVFKKYYRTVAVVALSLFAATAAHAASMVVDGNSGSVSFQFAYSQHMGQDWDHSIGIEIKDYFTQETIASASITIEYFPSFGWHRFVYESVDAGSGQYTAWQGGWFADSNSSDSLSFWDLPVSLGYEIHLNSSFEIDDASNFQGPYFFSGDHYTYGGQVTTYVGI